MRETADSVVVAFILAFVFRAFIIEAFVIPTGSMAATLYGSHGTMLCGDCGWEFAYGLTDPAAAPGRLGLLGPNESTVCPNCNHRNPITEINDRRGNAEAGDRILAFKWTYDVGGGHLGPTRWDVALFKDPSDKDSADGVTNFIKRLVGLPGEVLEIIDGDIYAVPVSELSERARTALEKARHAKYLRRTKDPKNAQQARLIERRLRTAWGAVLAELSGKLRIQRKTPVAQAALWSVVYDHDFPPRSPGPNQPAWIRLDPAQDGWNVTGRKLRFTPRDSTCEGLALRGARADDRVGYNIRDGGQISSVTDLRLRCVFTRFSGDGALLMSLPKRESAFWAELGSGGTIRLWRTSGPLPGDETPLAQARLPAFDTDTPVLLDFQNVDYRLSLVLNGRTVLETTPEQFAPDVAALRKLVPGPNPGEVRIYARGSSMELTHVVVERDVYYRSPGRHVDRRYQLSALTGAVWGGTGNPILLRDGEYFVLGDNSPASGDSRLWSDVGPHLADRGEDYQLGTVAADQLIGRAFFVYWPNGHRSEFIPFLDRYGMIPNVGQMRWIR